MAFFSSSTRRFRGSSKKARSRRPRSTQSIPRLFRSFKRLLLVLLALFPALGGAGFFLQGKVISVSDGDTFTLFTIEGEFKRVRLYGIDTPELRQPHGWEAAAHTRKRILWREVRLKTLNTDQYGRSVALVTLEDGGTLNAELVQLGLAWVYRAYCSLPVCAQWKTQEAHAKKNKQGLWQEKKPTPPWEWRKHKR